MDGALCQRRVNTGVRDGERFMVRVIECDVAVGLTIVGLR